MQGHRKHSESVAALPASGGGEGPFEGGPLAQLAIVGQNSWTALVWLGRQLCVRWRARGEEREVKGVRVRAAVLTVEEWADNLNW